MRSVAMFLVAVLLCAACASSKVIGDRTVQPIGIVSQLASGHNIVGIDPPAPCVEYTIVWGNVVWGSILIETIAAPIYFFGFSMFEPVGKQENCPAH